MAMKVKENVSVEFDEPPVVKSRKDAIKLLNLLMKAEYVSNGDYALMAIRDAIKKELV